MEFTGLSRGSNQASKIIQIATRQSRQQKPMSPWEGKMGRSHVPRTDLSEEECRNMGQITWDEPGRDARQGSAAKGV